MLFIISCLLFLIGSIMIFKVFKIRYAFSCGILIGIALSIIATISLSQNYTQSLIANVNDGIAISNMISSWIIGENGWSVERFKELFEQSTNITLLLILIYPFVLLFDAKARKEPNIKIAK
ncbi:hypothetical protein ACOI1C_15840 [Bacillus sp. DJP31]|uniref:hypothetical protein n=1 Tax=Bacillus sp. DJP31 TaxID=3409789 RepID=UPI003BB4DD28